MYRFNKLFLYIFKFYFINLFIIKRFNNSKKYKFLINFNYILFFWN